MATEQEKALADFKEADEEYQTIKEFVESGVFLKELLDRSQGNFSTASQIWKQIWEKLAESNEDRNSKLKVVKDILRRSVQLSIQQKRGPEGSASVLKADMFTVSSVTHRNLNAIRVMEMCHTLGLTDELQSLTYTNKAGSQVPALSVEYSVDYDRVMNWLKAKKLDNIIEAAYVEVEKTPAVKGPKETALLGEQRKE